MLNHIQPSGYDGAIQVPYGSLKKKEFNWFLARKDEGMFTISHSNYWYIEWLSSGEGKA